MVVGWMYGADDIEHQDYVVVNLKLTWRICRYVAVFARLENLTDSRYEINRGYVMPGFTAMGGFRLTF